MKKTGIKLILSAFLLLFAFSIFAAAAEPEMFEPDQVLKASSDSKTTYKLDLKNDADFETPVNSTLVSPWVQKVKEKETGYKYSVHTMSDKAKGLFNEGEKAFMEGNFKKAAELYNAAAKADPDFLVIYNYIGDAYYRMNDFENAKKYFEYGIKVNYCNYQVHWFLADTLWALGKKEEAAYEATVGHVLNRNHKELKKKMIYYREAAGKPWREWSYSPKCTIKKIDDKTVLITAGKGWIGYGMSKALWEYEPGYPEKHHVEGISEAELSSIREGEAMINAATGEGNEIIKQISDENKYVLRFVIYEVLSLETPARNVALEEEGVNSIIEYLDKYHTLYPKSGAK